MKKYDSLSRHKWALPFEVAMAVGAVVMFSKGDRLHVATSLFTLLASLAPLAVERIFRIRIPSLFQVIYVAFVFFSMFSGEVLRLYAHIAIWDDIIHFMSGVLLATTGVVVIREMIRRKQFVGPVGLQAIIALGFVATVIVIWEIVEFTSDQLFGTHSQNSSLVDTMLDLIDGIAGGAFVAIGLLVQNHFKRMYIFDVLAGMYAKLNR